MYGSQYLPDENGHTVMWKAVDPERLNERRKAVGLQPIDVEHRTAEPVIPREKLPEWMAAYERCLKEVGWR